MLVDLFPSFGGYDLFIREIRHADKNRTGPNKLIYEEKFSTFKFFYGQTFGYITHVEFTLITTPHCGPLHLSYFAIVISSNLIPRNQIFFYSLNVGCKETQPTKNSKKKKN